MDTNKFIKELNKYIAFAFINENEFLKEFFIKYVNKYKYVNLEEFYIASNICKIRLSVSDKPFIDHYIYTAIGTIDYLDWFYLHNK